MTDVIVMLATHAGDKWILLNCRGASVDCTVAHLLNLDYIQRRSSARGNTHPHAILSDNLV